MKRPLSIKKKDSVSHTKRDRALHPKLRLMRNGSSRVNLMRAQQSACSAAEDVKALRQVPPPLQSAPEESRASRLPPKRRPKISEVTSEVLVNVFVEFDRETPVQPDGREKPPAKLPGETGRVGNIATAQVPLSEISALLNVEGVRFVSRGDPLRRPITDNSSAGADGQRHSEAVADALATTVSIHRNGALADGRRVLLGFIDVGGFDFAHPDFLDRGGATRFLSIWDQGGSHRSSPKSNGTAPYDYGSELTAEHMNNAIRNAPTAGVSATDLEPQSGSEIGSHATHVASIAGGNEGICSEALLAGALIDLPREDTDRRRSFYDSTRIAHAVDYLLGLADKEGVPASINISLGTNGHAHDASSAVSRWIDSQLAAPGRSVCVAAGNSGQEGQSSADDFGFIMGRIHTSGYIPAKGLVHDISWLVIGNGIEDISENELEIWYAAQDRFAVSIRPPAGDWIGPIEPQRFLENHQLDDGSLVSVYSELYHPANGSNYISIYLSPFLEVATLDEVVGVRAGEWTVRLHGLDIRDGNFHGWIERDDPSRIGETDLWRFPSFFAAGSNVDNSSVSSLACGHRVVSVANLDEANDLINVTSSQGPTGDSRFKPEVAAPGTNIVAANGFAGQAHPLTVKSGTSMASPFVAGVVGLMLAAEPRLSAAQIGGIIKRTCQPLPGADFRWDDASGFGRIDLGRCVEEAARAMENEEVAP